MFRRRYSRVRLEPDKVMTEDSGPPRRRRTAAWMPWQRLAGGAVTTDTRLPQGPPVRAQAPYRGSNVNFCPPMDTSYMSPPLACTKVAMPLR